MHQMKENMRTALWLSTAFLAVLYVTTMLVLIAALNKEYASQLNTAKTPQHRPALAMPRE
jgi:preprotein translocase subunit SecG